MTSSINGSSSLGMYSNNGIIGSVRNSALEYNSANHQYSGVSRLNQSNSAPSPFDSSANFPLLSSANLSATGKGSSSLAYNSVASLSTNSSQQHRLVGGGEEDFSIENEDFPALPGSHHNSSKPNAVDQQQQQHGSSVLSSAGDRHGLQQQDLLNSSSQSSLFSGGGGFGHSANHSSVHSSSSIGGSELSINLSGRGGLLQPQGSALLNSSNLSQDSFSTSSTLSGPPPPPQPSQQALLHQQQQQQPGPPVNKDSKYGLSGLLDIIRYTDKVNLRIDHVDPHLIFVNILSQELNVLALGTDLTTFGLNLNAAESLYPSFLSPFSDSSSSQPEPPFSTPSCYLMHPPSLKTEHLSKFQLETLFYMFYSMPKDILQACAAQELYRREWRYHSELRLWLKPRTAQELMQSHPSVHFIYFEVGAWETRLFTTSTGRGNLAAGLLSEDEVRVKAPQPSSAPSMPLGGGPS